jgi:RNA polymerase sigma-70 factor, ECF subfamily
MGAANTGQHDAALPSRWNQGDPAAFEALVRHWEQPVARFLARMTAGTDQVADLCQEVFLRVYLARDRYQETGAFSTWLYRIALNVARDRARRRRREPASLAEHEPLSSVEPAGAASAKQELSEAVASALAALPPPMREVVVLRHYEGMRFEAIARVTGIPASTLKSRFAAALARLRTALQTFDERPEEAES